MALNKIEKMCLIAITAMLAACGDEVTEVTEVTQVVGMQVVEEGDALPKCNTENEGQMVYSVDSAAAYYCIGEKWTTMKGKDGADGKDGKDGEDGADGKNGKDGKDGVNGSNGTNGSDGTDGKDGADGTNGNDGQNCEIVSDTNGVLTLKCGDDTTTLYKAVCNLTPYDPMKQYCSVHGIFDLEKCGDKLYNPETHLCDIRDSSLYRHVTIGMQVWMAENLNYKVDSSSCYKDSAKYCEKYGRLYQWSAAVGKSEEECGYGKECSLPLGLIQGVCPNGWHLPREGEWEDLLTTVGGRSLAGKILKSQTGWGYGGNGTDAYGFSALPAGIRETDGVFRHEGVYAFFCSCTEADSVTAINMKLADYRNANLTNYTKRWTSVRCIKDR